MLGLLPFVEDPGLSVSAARALAQLLPPCFTLDNQVPTHTPTDACTFERKSIPEGDKGENEMKYHLASLFDRVCCRKQRLKTKSSLVL